MQCGLVGLPNVGKSTIFHAITAAPAEIANYPFCTIEPNIGIVTVPDVRLAHIAELFVSEQVIPTVVRFVDIAGLVSGASQGEGLGNTFLAHIRECNAICHVVRCFADPEVTHTSDSIDPCADFEIINTELALADIETIEKRMNANDRLTRGSDAKKAAKARKENEWLSEINTQLSAALLPTYEEWGDECVRLVSVELSLLTAKKQIIVCNVDEASITGGENRYADALADAYGDRFPLIRLCGKLESELADIEDNEERSLFVAECGITESGLAQLIRTAYDTLGLCTFFTAGKNESRAWTYACGSTVAESAGRIHTDFQRGFIKAEVYHYTDLVEHKNEAALRQAGLIRVEGKDYLTHDGDVLFVHAH